ncbi:MAG TPA: hypothetical protein VHR39_10090, partial [Propionibacteriaceae bacterium]|nr:hypothetical protein [Propionibacteriaceae bacterium]
NRVGFEVRLEVRLAEDDAAPPVLVTLTRAEATAKALETGVPVWIRPVVGASQVRITTPATAGAETLEMPQEPPLSPPGSVREPTFT